MVFPGKPFFFFLGVGARMGVFGWLLVLAGVPIQYVRGSLRSIYHLILVISMIHGYILQCR